MTPEPCSRICLSHNKLPKLAHEFLFTVHNTSTHGHSQVLSDDADNSNSEPMRFSIMPDSAALRICRCSSVDDSESGMSNDNGLGWLAAF
jgi:hypothetical protein